MAAAKKAAAQAAAAPRRKPDFRGVQGTVVAGDVVAGLEGRGLLWTGRGQRISPYDAQLADLKQRTVQAVAKGEPAPALEFPERRAEAALRARAKRLDLRLVFADFEGRMYVRLDGIQGDPAVARRKNIAAALKKYGPLPVQRLTGQLREDGDETLDAATVTLILHQMSKAGDVLQQDGGAWRLAPGRAA